ncbi:MAG: alpha-2-macroglobulin family protein [Sediminibacterium sp.]
MANLPDKPFRSLVTYRNVETLFARIIRVDNYENARDALNTEFWRSMARRKIYKSFIQKLPFTNDDHQAHSTEIKIDALPIGQYALLTSSSEDFNDTLDKMGVQFFTVSNISYVQNKTDFFVLRRDNGKPIPNATINIIKSTYDGKQSRWIDEKVEERTSDRNGFFSYAMPRYTYNISLQISKANDKLDLRQRDQLYNEYDPPNSDEDAYEKNRRIFFYTDRGIYRPGQTVFFKGIAITTDFKTKLSKLYTSKKSVKVYLRDANGKKYDSLGLTLNEYGSLNGKFLLPQNVLTGRFSIMTEGFHQLVAEFNVEEYKRPTFSVVFEKAKGAYRLNDSVTIIGNVNAFAGNHIDGANVVYSVRRNNRFIDWWSYRRPYPAGTNREISHGEVKTDAQGKFTITFKASVDDLLNRTGNPLYDFNVSADVTDNNGETRSSSTTVTVGKSSLLLQITAPEETDVDSLKKIKISSTNLSYEKEPATVRLKIYSLVAPDRVIRKRYWQRPDQFVMTKNEFINAFPNDEYEEESNASTWATGALITEGTVDTKNNEFFAIPEGILNNGYYKIEATAVDKYGEETRSVKYISLYSTTKKLPASLSYQSNYILNPIAKPGETASFIRSSAADELFVIRKTDRPRRKNEDYTFIDKPAKFETITFKPDESDRGGVAISEVYVFNNRVYTYTYGIDVPWNNKELAVKYATYRDKTEPGSKETWTVTVQNDKNENAPAELMTGMYDASLDQFKPVNWTAPAIWERHGTETMFIGATNFNSQQSRENYIPEKYIAQMELTHDHLASDASELINKNLTRWLNDSTLHISVTLKRSLESLDEVVIAGYGVSKDASAPEMMIRGRVAGLQSQKVSGNMAVTKATPPQIVADEMVKGEDEKEDAPAPDNTPVTIRKNFNETAFFFPQLYADSSGKYTFSFTMPDALTQWKWMSLAHTKDLAFGTYSTNIITQKKLMIQGNAPRFMREGDNMEFSTKIVNMSEKEITGQATLELVDPLTNNSVDGWFQNVFPSQFFTVEPGQSFAVKFPIQIPYGYNRPITWRIKARAGEFSDGEENILPVLTNRILVTESLPLFLASDTTKNFVFEKLVKTNSESLTHEGLTVEYTSNPVWYAVQALPYLMEYPYECAEQTFNRFYANALASYIINKNPRIKQVFEQWKKDSSSLKSNLQKNEELKQILLQETPWVMQAESEEQQKKNLALLFDLAKIGAQTDATIAKLTQMQLPNGSFSWFKGGGEDRYITNYILTGIGKLKRLGALSPEAASGVRIMLVNALKYSDSKIAEDYNWLVKNKATLNIQHISTSQIDYLYMRSFFRDIAQQSQKEYDYYFKQGKQFWVKQNSYYKAQLGLIYYRNNEEKFATEIVLPALLENTVIDSKLGMYWKSTYTGFWYQSPVEHQSMMIAFMSEINMDQKNTSLTKNINSMKTWLLLNKQTTNWRTTIATADACYALLLNGSDWLNADKKVTIQLGKTVISSSNEKTEAATGYFKKRIDGEKVKPEMGNITVTVNSNSPNSKIASSSPSWGSVYWQYFEEMDKITTAASPLSLTKKLFVERNTDKGKLLEPVKENQELKTGDKIVVRIELRSDRDMDYLHLKDMRAASMEPVNVLSGYKWQDGLGYYESTKDASTNFFIDHLRKGTYVFDYPLFITHTGIFSAGIATIQCMYAPEFTSHSEGIKIRVAK